MDLHIVLALPKCDTYGDAAALEQEIEGTNVVSTAVKLLVPDLDPENLPDEIPSPKPIVVASAGVNPSNARPFFTSIRANVLALTMLGMEGVEIPLPPPPPEACEELNQLAAKLMELYETRVKPMEEELARIRAEVEAGNLDPYAELSEREAKVIQEGYETFEEETVLMAIAATTPMQIMMEAEANRDVA